MQTVRARVKNGRLVVDEPTELPEGTEVELAPVGEDLDDEERARLLAAIDRGVEDFENGDTEDAFALLARLKALGDV